MGGQRLVRNDVLWACAYETGEFVGVTGVFDARHAICVFSSPMKAAAWAQGMRIKGARISPPLFPKNLLHTLREAKKIGWQLATLDPPSSAREQFQATEIENLIAQVEERV